MNHESSDSTFDAPSSSHQLPTDASTSQSPQETTAATPTASHADIRRLAKESVKRYRTQFLDHLLRQLDIMVYCELSILYYMDCSFISFLVRACSHWFYFTPKPPIMSPLITWNRPHIIMIFFLNLLSILLHAISSPPTAGEAVRGYLHGGLLIDFVGQKSPVSRWRLVGYDILILVLQLVMLGTTVERKKLDASESASAGQDERREEDRQDHDSEERGVRRSSEGVEGTEGIQLRSLSSRSERTEGGEDEDRDETTGANESTAHEHPGDAFYSGRYMIADIHVVNMIREQWRQTQPSVTGNDNDRSMRAAAAAELARRRLRFRIRIGGRDYGS